MLRAGKFAALKNISALAMLGALVINSAFAEDKSAALVNGVSIPQARIELRVKAAAAQGQPDSPELRKAISEEMINLEVMAHEAVKLDLDKNAEVVQQIELAKQQILSGVFVQNYVKNHPISEDQLKQEYDKLKAKLGSKEYSARHILVKTEDEAKDVIAQLGKEAKFETLAAKSKDAGSAAQGGALGWAVPGKFVPEFANAMLNLKQGEYTKKPVQSRLGWHVIKLDDIRDLKVPTFEEAKPQLQQRLQQQSIKQAIDELRAKAKTK